MPRKAAPLAPGAPPKKPDIRARRVLEIAQLKGENESLKKEREELKDTVTSLKRVVDGEDARDDVERENLLLRNEIAQHQEFIRSLHEILDAEAVLAAQIRGEIYQQGAESARAFVLSLINDSAAWPAAAVPEEVPMPLPDLQFRCSVQPGGTGQPDRLSLRIDLLLPFATQPEVVQNLFFDVFRNEKLTQRLQRASPDVKLQSVDAPTQDTELILFRHDTEKGDKETLFILHRYALGSTGRAGSRGTGTWWT
jgi:FtsZ-binding cell division protein ZapB